MLRDETRVRGDFFGLIDKAFGRVVLGRTAVRAFRDQVSLQSRALAADTAIFSGVSGFFDTPVGRSAFPLSWRHLDWFSFFQ
jgi:hypothetical protein